MDEGPPKSAATSRLPRDFLNEKPMESIRSKEDPQQRRAIPGRTGAPGSKTHSNCSLGDDIPSRSSSGEAEFAVNAPATVLKAKRSIELPSIPLNGRPENFGLVQQGVYRSSYPYAQDYGFIANLGLKTMITLVKKDELDHELGKFVVKHGIHHVIVNMQGTKKEAIPPDTMRHILSYTMDEANYPLLIHCNHGKHRTGCVVGAMRKLSGWNAEDATNEYKSYAQPKIRECDVEYIGTFQSSMPGRVMPLARQPSAAQIRTFFRTVLFTIFIMIVWLVTESRIAGRKDKLNL